MTLLFGRFRALCVAGGVCIGGSAFFSPFASCDVFPRPPPVYPSSSSSLIVTRGNEGVATAAAALALNTIVHIMWRLPNFRLRGFMDRWFVSWGRAEGGRALSGRNLARALLSSISHRGALHLAFNMLGVWSFTPGVIDGAESLARPKLAPAEYGALWAASGAASALASSAFSARFGSGAGGLGASGFLFSLLTFRALSDPDSRVVLLFFYECSIREALGLATVANIYLVAKDVLASRGACAWEHASRPCNCGPSCNPPPPPCVPPYHPPLRAHTIAAYYTLGGARVPIRPPTVDGMAHLVGTAVGFAAYAWARERARRRRRERKARGAPGGRGAAVTVQRPPGHSARV